MKILDFSKDKLEKQMEFGRDTVMVMCRVPKVIVFESSDQLCTFKRVWENVITEYLESDEELDEKYEWGYISGWYIDQFEEESDMRDEEEYSSRNLTLIDISNEDIGYDDTMQIKFGVLNSKDTYTDMDVLSKQVELIDLMFNTLEMSRRLKDSTKEMFKTIRDIWAEDLECYKNGSDYFKVMLAEKDELEYELWKAKILS